MIPLYTPAQVRALDEAAIAGGTPVATLMEHAAAHVARAAISAAGRSYGARVALVCGKGNNGGDGIAAGRRLIRMGAAPVVCLVAGEDGLNELGREQLRRYRAAGGRVVPSVEHAVAGADVVVDCLLGTGATGAPRPPFDSAIAAVNSAGYRGARVVACDVPSGVDADTGEVPDEAVQADVTVTLGAHKRGLWMWPARGYCGSIVLGDIGLGNAAPVARVMTDADALGPLADFGATAEKRDRGVVVVLAGSAGMSGAATLVARGVLSLGAGLLTVATRADVRPLVAPTVPEALTLAVPEDPDHALQMLVERLDGADVLAIGPGLGHEPQTVKLVRRLVREIDVPMVLDADGLNAFRDAGDELSDHKAFVVCTPHVRELARMAGADADTLWPNRVREVGRLARKWNVMIVAKGPGTLIEGPPDDWSWINASGSAALATGGTGDVLTGMLASVLAHGPGPLFVAAAVHLHGRAGELAARRKPARSVTAMDVALAVPDALRLMREAA